LTASHAYSTWEFGVGVWRGASWGIEFGFGGGMRGDFFGQGGWEDG